MTVQNIEAIIEFIESDQSTDEAFNKLALDLFHYQFEHNLPYRAFCQKKGKTPRTVKMWNQIPPISIDAFKELALSCIDPEKAQRIFMTSGTTRSVQGKHYHPSLTVYDLSMIKNFRNRFMQSVPRIRMGILFPTEQDMPNSSLAHYLSLAVREFGTKDSQYFLDQRGLAIEALIQEILHIQETGEPYALLGASYSFVHLFDGLDARGIVFRLPPGSRILDTGGFKNQSREVEPNEFYDRLSHFMGIDRKDCINMYGMTELSTQYYDCGNRSVPSVKSGPHWIRTRIINPLTGEDMPKGTQGIIVHCDLANYNSVTTILTEDIGQETDNGFLLLGRAEGTEAKGCSIAVEDIILAEKGL